MSVIAGQNQDPSKIAIKEFKISSSSPNVIDVEVFYVEPLFISLGDSPDLLRVEILDLQKFLSPSGDKMSQTKTSV